MTRYTISMALAAGAVAAVITSSGAELRFDGTDGARIAGWDGAREVLWVNGPAPGTKTAVPYETIRAIETTGA
jgi:hypothetical protein